MGGTGGKVAWYRKWLGWAFSAVWAILVFCAIIPAGSATSNLQSWANLLGLPTLGKYLAGSGTDNIALFLALISIAKHLAKLKTPLEDAFRIVRKALWDEYDR